MYCFANIYINKHIERIKYIQTSLNNIGMEGLTLLNFKSYKKETITNFNPYINIILGANGQGKSNLFKALSFALSDRLQINRSQFSAYIHHGMNISNDQPIEVEILIKQPLKQSGSRQSSRQLVKLAKLWKNDLKQECYVNSKMVNKKQYENYVESLCLSYTNPYNIIQQGKINQIILMDEFQLFKLMEQITGVKKFNKRKEEALAILNKIQNEKVETKGILDELNQKLKTFQDRKQQFQYYAAQQKTKKYRTKKHYVQLMESTKHNLQKIKNEYEELSENLGKVMAKKQTIQQKLEQNVIFIRIQKDKLALIGKTVAAQQQQYYQSQEIKQLERNQKEIHKELKQQAKKMREKDKIIDNFKKDFAQLQQNYQSLKISKQLQKPKQSKQKLLLAYETQIKNEQNSLHSMRLQKQKSQEKIKQLQKFLNSKKNLQTQAQNQKLQQQVKSIREEITENNKQISQLIWQRGMHALQLSSMKQILTQSQSKLRKMLPNLDLTLLSHLRQQKMKGVYGYLIQFVTIDSSVSFAYQIAGMHTLTSLLVQNQQACIAVVQANRRIKGGQVNIAQLDFVRNQPMNSQAAIKVNGVYKLSNNKFIKPNVSQIQMNSNTENTQVLLKDIQKLIKNTFQKYALVKDYDAGLQISKEYHINCITGDRQIVYSKGYHCKIGQEGVYQDCKLDIFYKYQQKKGIFLVKCQEKQILDQKLLQFQNNSIKLVNKQQKINIQLNKMAYDANQITTQKKMLQVYQTNVQKINKNQQQIRLALQKKQQAVKTIQQAGSKSQPSKFSPAQCQKIQTSYHTKRKQLNKMLTQIFELQQTLQKLTIQKQQIDNKVINTKNAKASGLINPNQIFDEIQKVLTLKQKQNKEMQKQVSELNHIQEEIERNRNHVEIKLITYRAEQEDIEGKLTEIGEIQEDVEELEELSNSMSVSALHGRKKHHFSARDKILFTKLATIIETFGTHKKTFAELEQSQQKIRDLIQNYEKQSEEYLQQISTKFQKQFNDIFSYIVNQGTAQIRFKKVSQKARDNTTRYKSCLSVKVSFSHSAEVMKKWNDFSGGERTVIAISIIFALQRCQPAPFYVLDEIDAALDNVYVQKIAELLARESQRNKCQYFISSFKQDMMSFPEEICNYYLVSAENRQSFIEKIRKNKAVDTLRSISNKNGHNNNF